MFHFNYVEREFKMCKCLPVQFTRLAFSLLTIWNNSLLTIWNSSNAILSVETPQGSLGMPSSLEFTFDWEIFSEMQVNRVCNEGKLVSKAL